MNMKNNESENLELFDGEVIPPYLAVKAMRDSGYKNTAYALAELIDNAIQATADTVEVFCFESRVIVSERERKRLSTIGVLDNGSGMNASTLRQALQFGNGTRLNDRSGIGRFGMGLPNSSISQCRRLDVWTWQTGPDNAIHTYLDLNDIEGGNSRSVPTPELDPLPEKWRSLSKALTTKGTLVVWSGFDEHRLTWKGSRATLDHTETLIGRMYRKFIDDGSVEIRFVALDEDSVIDERLAKANDPLYLMTSSCTPAPFNTKAMFQKWGESDAVFPIEYNDSSSNVTVRLSWATQETVPQDGTNRGDTLYGKHAAKNIGVSIVRAKRELELDSSWANGYDPRERWWGVEVDFPPELDEVFGVTNNKQTATTFSHMSQFDWETEAEPGEKYMDFKQRLKDEGDTRVHLIDIVNYINEQLGQLRTRLHDQTKGQRGGGSRHEDTSVEDTATTKWKERAESGYEAESDNETFDKDAQDALVKDLVESKHYPDSVAREIAEAVEKRGRKIIFVTAESDSQAFFQVDPRPGGITEIILNTRHPAYNKLWKVLDTNVSEANASELIERIDNASTTLKLLLAAWARYEEEDVPSRDKIRDIRHEWGKMAKNFIGEGE